MGSASEPRKVFTYIYVFICLCVYIYAHINTSYIYLRKLAGISSLDHTLTVLGSETSLALKPFERNCGFVIEVFPGHHSGRMGE